MKPVSDMAAPYAKIATANKSYLTKTGKQGSRRWRHNGAGSPRQAHRLAGPDRKHERPVRDLRQAAPEVWRRQTGRPFPLRIHRDRPAASLQIILLGRFLIEPDTSLANNMLAQQSRPLMILFFEIPTEQPSVPRFVCRAPACLLHCPVKGPSVGDRMMPTDGGVQDCSSISPGCQVLLNQASRGP